MDRPPHPTPGNSTPDDARPASPPQETALSSDLPTLAPSPVSATSLGRPTTLTVLGQRYEILGEAGRGAMGQVYKARDRETGDTVALKLLKEEIASDQDMVSRFKSELLFARKITHKNVCRVYEFNRVEGIAYTSMEFVEGENLRSVLNRFGALTLRKGLDLALQMCSGLSEAHAQGIVHRDLKPENVMIDPQGNLKIMDFGIARSLESLTKLTGAMTGTPAYMAPEQAMGKPVDARTDIYALGLMLYEMFTGTQAFHADTAVALALKQMNEAPIPPREIEPSIPVPLEDAILKSIEKDPAARFQSVAALETVLRSQAPDPTATVSGSRMTGAQTSRGHTSASAPLSQPIGPDRSAIAVQTAPSRTKWMYTVVILTLILAGALAALYARRVAGSKRNAAQNLAPLPQTSAPPAPIVPDQTSAASAPATSTAVPLSPKALPKPPIRSKNLEAPPSKAVPVLPAHATLSENAPTPPPAPSAQPITQDQTTATASNPSEDEPPTIAGPPGARNRPAFIWVGRFAREAGAQNTARKIEDMGLPVTVMPRHNPKTNSDFFAVFTGPFAVNTIDDVMKQLQAKGFANAHKAGGLGTAQPHPAP